MNWQGRNRKGTIPGSRWSKQSYTVTGSTLKEKTNDSAAFSEKGNLICASELLHRGKEWTGSAFVVPVRYWSPRKSTTDFTMKYHAARHLERLEITHTRTYKHTHTHTHIQTHRCGRRIEDNRERGFTNSGFETRIQFTFHLKPSCNLCTPGCVFGSIAETTNCLKSLQPSRLLNAEMSLLVALETWP